MAKKIDEKMARSFVNRTVHMASNTAVIVTMHAGLPPLAHGYAPTVIEMILHGNKIASWCPELGSFYTTLAGYNTVTTRARLNTLIYAMTNHHNGALMTYYQKKGEVYWGNQLVTDLMSLQWHTVPPYGKTHPLESMGPETGIYGASSPAREPLTYDNNLEMLL